MAAEQSVVSQAIKEFPPVVKQVQEQVGRICKPDFSNAEGNLKPVEPTTLNVEAVKAGAEGWALLNGPGKGMLVYDVIKDNIAQLGLGAITAETTPQQKLEMISVLFKQLEENGFDPLVGKTIILETADGQAFPFVPDASQIATALQVYAIDLGQQIADELIQPQVIAGRHEEIEEQINYKTHRLRRQAQGMGRISSTVGRTSDGGIKLSEEQDQLWKVKRDVSLEMADGQQVNFDSLSREIDELTAQNKYGVFSKLEERFASAVDAHAGDIAPRVLRLIHQRLGEKDLDDAMRKSLTDLTKGQENYLYSADGNVNADRLKDALAILFPFKSDYGELVAAKGAEAKQLRLDLKRKIQTNFSEWSGVMFGHEGLQRTVSVDLRMADGVCNAMESDEMKAARIEMKNLIKANYLVRDEAQQPQDANMTAVLQRIQDHVGMKETDVQNLRDLEQMQQKATLRAFKVRVGEKDVVTSEDDAAYEALFMRLTTMGERSDAVKAFVEKYPTLTALSEEVAKKYDVLQSQPVLKENTESTLRLIKKYNITLTAEQTAAIVDYLKAETVLAYQKLTPERKKAKMSPAEELQRKLWLKPESATKSVDSLTDDDWKISKEERDGVRAIISEGRRVASAVAQLGMDQAEFAGQIDQWRLGGDIEAMALKGLYAKVRMNKFAYGETVDRTITVKKQVEIPEVLAEKPKVDFPTEVQHYSFQQVERKNAADDEEVVEEREVDALIPEIVPPAEETIPEIEEVQAPVQEKIIKKSVMIVDANAEIRLEGDLSLESVPEQKVVVSGEKIKAYREIRAALTVGEKAIVYARRVKGDIIVSGRMHYDLAKAQSDPDNPITPTNLAVQNNGLVFVDAGNKDLTACFSLSGIKLEGTKSRLLITSETGDLGQLLSNKGKDKKKQVDQLDISLPKADEVSDTTQGYVKGLKGQEYLVVPTHNIEDKNTKGVAVFQIREISGEGKQLILLDAERSGESNPRLKDILQKVEEVNVTVMTSETDAERLKKTYDYLITDIDEDHYQDAGTNWRIVAKIMDVIKESSLDKTYQQQIQALATVITQNSGKTDWLQGYDPTEFEKIVLSLVNLQEKGKDIVREAGYPPMDESNHLQNIEDVRRALVFGVRRMVEATTSINAINDLLTSDTFNPEDTETKSKLIKIDGLVRELGPEWTGKLPIDQLKASETFRKAAVEHPNLKQLFIDEAKAVIQLPEDPEAAAQKTLLTTLVEKAKAVKAIESTAVSSFVGWADSVQMPIIGPSIRLLASEFSAIDTLIDESQPVSARLKEAAQKVAKGFLGQLKAVPDVLSLLATFGVGGSEIAVAADVIEKGIAQVTEEGSELYLVDQIILSLQKGLAQVPADGAHKPAADVINGIVGLIAGNESLKTQVVAALKENETWKTVKAELKDSPDTIIDKTLTRLTTTIALEKNSTGREESCLTALGSFRNLEKALGQKQRPLLSQAELSLLQKWAREHQEFQAMINNETPHTETAAPAAEQPAEASIPVSEAIGAEPQNEVVVRKKQSLI